LDEDTAVMLRRAFLVEVLGLVACFDPQLGDSPFACGPDQACPPGYACRDGTCTTAQPSADAPIAMVDARTPKAPNVDAPLPVVDALIPAGDAPAPIPDARPADAPFTRPPDARHPPDPACTPVELLHNGDFDSSSGPNDARDIAPWVASRSNPPLVLNDGELFDLGAFADTLPFAAALAGDDGADGTLDQMVLVPAGSRAWSCQRGCGSCQVSRTTRASTS
jgi:hypothetical protein